MMLKQSDTVIIKDIPAGRKLPEAIKGAEAKVIEMHKYGSSFFYDIQLNNPVEGIDKLPLFRGNLLKALAPKPSSKDIKKMERAHKEDVDRHTIGELKEELKAWPLPKQFDKNSDTYNRVWLRRMRLHSAIAKTIKNVEGKV